MHISQLFSRKRFLKAVLFLGGVCLLAALASFFFKASAGGVAQGPELISPQPRTIDSTLSVVGVIESGSFLPVSAPFDGVLQDKSFVFDSLVTQGQVMLSLDTAELQGRINEAKVAMLKALKTLQELQGWKEGAEFSRAQRGLLLAQQQVDQGERKVKEAGALFEKGIISRDEYEGLCEQLTSYKTQMAVAADDLKSTKEKASGHNLEIAQLEYEQQKLKYDELKALPLRATIKAPSSGIVSRVPVASGQAAVALEKGSRVGKGQVLFYVASTDVLKVSAKVDEVDVTGLSVGMKVQLVLDSKDMPPIEGRLVAVAAQASSGSESTRNPTFDIQIEVPALTDVQRQHLRIGMSCNVSIVKG